MNSKKILKFVVFLAIVFAIVFFCLGKDLLAFACILFIFVSLEGYGQFNSFVDNSDDNKTKSP